MIEVSSSPPLPPNPGHAGNFLKIIYMKPAGSFRDSLRTIRFPISFFLPFRDAPLLYLKRPFLSRREQDFL